MAIIALYAECQDGGGVGWGGVGEVQREAKDVIIIIIIIIIIITREGELETFTALKVSRRCPLVLL